MKLAILSDTHGNLAALETALDDAKQHGIEDFICLGDVGNFGPQPKKTLELVRELNCPVVMGNTDYYLLSTRTIADIEKSGRTPDEQTPMILEIENWCAAQIDEADRTFLRTFKPTIELNVEGLKILAYHGSPKSFNDPITGTTPDETLRPYFENTEADLYMGGHTHEQFIRRHFTKRVMNPGSVGLPFVSNLGSNAGVNLGVAEYAILEVIQGEPNVTFRRVRYDVGRLEQAAKASGMPHVENWLGWK
jgi:putative phosphoesterase